MLRTALIGLLAVLTARTRVCHPHAARGAGRDLLNLPTSAVPTRLLADARRRAKSEAVPLSNLDPTRPSTRAPWNESSDFRVRH